MGAEGCGLLRTEFLFMDRDAALTEMTRLYWENNATHAPVDQWPLPA